MKLTGPAEARNVDRRSSEHTESWQEVPQPHDKSDLICQLSVHLRDLPSTFHAAADIMSTFLAPAQPSINFHQLSVRSRDLP